MKNSALFFVMVSLTALLINCGSVAERKVITEQRFEVKPPMKNVDVGYMSYDVSPVDDQLISTSYGTTLEIPKDAFVDDNNKPVKQVRLKYREVKKPAEIISSGISMQYDSAGTSYQLETGGMFELKAYNVINGDQCQLAEGKSISVNMPTNDGSGYNFYYYNETKGWVYDGSAAPQQNPEKAERIRNIRKRMPKQTQKPQAYHVMNDQVLDIKTDYQQFNELAKYKGLMWKYAGSMSKAEVADITKKRWYESVLERIPGRKDAYLLKLKRKTYTAELEVAPVLAGRNFEIAMEEYDKTQKEIDKLQDEIEDLEKQDDMVRSYNVVSLGLCNWDRIYKDPQRVWLSADFNIDGMEAESPIDVYHITQQGKVVVKYEPASYGKFSFNPKKENCIVAILPNNQVAVCSNDYFKSITVNENTESTSHLFNLNKLNRIITDVSELDDVIAQL